MKIAILSCGACLHDQWPAANHNEYAHIIAVNGACEHYPCDLICAGDLPRLVTLRPLTDRLRELFIPRNHFAAYAGGAFPALPPGLSLAAWEDHYPPREQVPAHFLNYSMPIALLRAHALAPSATTEIHIYGHSGGRGPALDPTQSKAPPWRWGKERRCFVALAAWTGLDIHFIGREDY
jgi:hypothetical protein